MSKYKDMDNILIHSIIISSLSGLPLFDHQPKCSSKYDKFDSTLIVVICAAVALMWNKILTNFLGFDFIESSGVVITTHRTKYSTLTIISYTKPNSTQLDRLRKIHEKLEIVFPDIKKNYRSPSVSKFPKKEVIRIFANNGVKICN